MTLHDERLLARWMHRDIFHIYTALAGKPCVGSEKVNIDDMHGKIRAPLINIVTVLIRSSDGEGAFCFIHDLDHRWKNWV